MSLDIDLIDRTTGEVIADMNWFRNPFGLERWADGNVGHLVKIPKGKTLWYVCNHWNYKESSRINRMLFKMVVDEYWKHVKQIEIGVIVFSFKSFVQNNHRELCMNEYEFRNDDRDIAVFMKPTDPHNLDYYKAWFKQLVDFADKLQDPKMKFLCSN